MGARISWLVRGAIAVAAVSASAAAYAEGAAGAATVVRATEARPRPAFIATVGYDYGLSKLLEVGFADGSTESLRMNGGFVLSIGAAFLPLRGGLLETRATLGVKYDAITATNGSVRFLAFPLEVMEAVNVLPLRLAAGVSVLLAPTIRGEDFLAGADLDLKSSLGLVGQAEWVFPFRGGRGSISAGVRGTWQKLEPKVGGGAADASAVGAVLGVTL